MKAKTKGKAAAGFGRMGRLAFLAVLVAWSAAAGEEKRSDREKWEGKEENGHSASVEAARNDAGAGPAEPMASGKFGLEAGNPVRTVNIDLEYRYLERLSGADGKPVKALRWGSFYEPGFPGPMDRWSVETGANRYVDLYLYPYAEENTLAAPEGFRLDLKGIGKEFEAAEHERLPPGRGEEVADPERPAAVPAANDAETARLGGIAVPPPAGWANLRIRPELFESYKPVSLVDWETEGENTAAFTVLGGDSGWKGEALARIANGGRPVEWARFRVETDLRKAMLYRRGMRSGTLAPHRSNEQSLQWTEIMVLPYRGGRDVHVQSFGVFWLKGRQIELQGKAITVPGMAFGMEVIAESRRFLEDWEDGIRAANGIPVDSPWNGGKTGKERAGEAGKTLKAVGSREEEGR